MSFRDETPTQAFWRVANRFEPEGYRLGVDPEFEAILLDPDQRFRGLYVIGHPGTGKTTLLQNLMLQDLQAGHGFALISPEQETFTEQVLPFIPPARREDVIYLNPLDLDRPIPFNPLHVTPGTDLDAQASHTLSILRRIFEDNSAATPRMNAILRHVIRTLLLRSGSTLLDAIPLCTDPTFRAKVLSEIDDEDLTRFWDSVYPTFGRDAYLTLFNRLDSVLSSRYVRAVLCTPGACLDLRGAMESGKILLVNLPDGLIGEDAALIIGQLVVAKLQLASLSRADMSIEERRPFYVYIDEFHTFCNTAVTSYGKMLTRGRKYRAPLILAHQQLGSISQEVLKDIFGTVSTIVAFAVDDNDARRLAREMGLKRHHSLRHLAVGTAYCRSGGRLTGLLTDHPATGGSARAMKEVIANSRRKYGVMVSGQSREGPTSAPPGHSSPGIDDLDPGNPFS
ncbi:MAG TPA: hypothetical protein VLL94_08895 [Nitrospiraceae bacterium]|nr:hypothetical protein [Nitrospiraceae bacterium]